MATSQIVLKKSSRMKIKILFRQAWEHKVLINGPYNFSEIVLMQCIDMSIALIS